MDEAIWLKITALFITSPNWRQASSPSIKGQVNNHGISIQWPNKQESNGKICIQKDQDEPTPSPVHVEQNKLATEGYGLCDSFIGSSTVLIGGWFCPCSGMVFGNGLEQFPVNSNGDRLCRGQRGWGAN